MLGRKIAALALLATLGSGIQAQDLSTYDPNNYSGGYAEGIYSPMGDEQLYPFDSQDQWQHGYIQYMPFYGAYEHFRPYNYKHVSAQAQTAAGWGMSARMPYSQQFWHRYHAHSKMGHPASGAYENFLNVPVPQKTKPEVQEEFYEEDLQPVNPPELTSPMEANSVRFAPRMAPHVNNQPAPGYAPNGHAGVSYQQMQPQPSQFAPQYGHPQHQQPRNPGMVPTGQAVRQAPAQAQMMIPGQAPAQYLAQPPAMAAESYRGGHPTYQPAPQVHSQPVLTLPPAQQMVPGSQPVLRVP